MDQDSGMFELEFPLPDVTTPDGSGPVLLHALEGFTDAGHAVRIATAHLLDTLESEPVATFDIDALLDYRSRRPVMTFRDNRFTDYATPRLDLHRVLDANGVPFLLLSGLEPDLKWDRFTGAVCALIDELGVERTIGLSAIPMAVPHTRPTGVTSHSGNSEIRGDYHKWDGEMSIPGSVAGLLELRLTELEHPTLGFAVHVPHYLAQSDYPGSAEKLLECVMENTDLQLPLTELGTAAARVREQIDGQVQGNEEVAGVVKALENQYDAYVTAEERRSSLLAEEGDLPSGEELGAEFERFLAEQFGGKSGDNPGQPFDSGSGRSGGEAPGSGAAEDGTTGESSGDEDPDGSRGDSGDGDDRPRT
ncbi:proteasome assembly chaperone family protein [Tomitella fengzijianii]|uniref:PAC2 family protein n=1 Tax=Tomitella fengzijianii TaxID=2597660 RepID=A0A516X882_9ACTN|nr:PAC2 family protein [Tomitella fengzijianii]QDQ99233.1 PAC2 family protein [Tomitella fengzijianii]